MLVLSRKKNQGVTIDNGVRVSVVAINGRYVKLGFEAPRGLRIVRDELLGRPELDPCNACPLACADCVEVGKVPPCQRPKASEIGGTT